MCSTHAFSNRSSTLPFPSPHVPLPMSPLCRVPYPSSEAGSSGAVRVPAPLCLPGAASGEAWAGSVCSVGPRVNQQWHHASSRLLRPLAPSVPALDSPLPSHPPPFLTFLSFALGPPFSCFEPPPLTLLCVCIVPLPLPLCVCILPLPPPLCVCIVSRPPPCVCALFPSHPPVCVHCSPPTPLCVCILPLPPPCVCTFFPSHPPVCVHSSPPTPLCVCILPLPPPCVCAFFPSHPPVCVHSSPPTPLTLAFTHSPYLLLTLGFLAASSRDAALAVVAWGAYLHCRTSKGRALAGNSGAKSAPTCSFPAPNPPPFRSPIPLPSLPNTLQQVLDQPASVVVLHEPVASRLRLCLHDSSAAAAVVSEVCVCLSTIAGHSESLALQVLDQPGASRLLLCLHDSSASLRASAQQGGVREVARQGPAAAGRLVGMGSIGPLLDAVGTWRDEVWWLSASWQLPHQTRCSAGRGGMGWHGVAWGGMGRHILAAGPGSDGLCSRHPHRGVRVGALTWARNNRGRAHELSDEVGKGESGEATAASCGGAGGGAAEGRFSRGQRCELRGTERRAEGGEMRVGEEGRERFGGPACDKAFTVVLSLVESPVTFLPVRPSPINSCEQYEFVRAIWIHASNKIMLIACKPHFPALSPFNHSSPSPVTLLPS
ncbi:unnamed protein product [Closterium sp. Naga37s-1]|nr:unnamed protein product [Closterium sp. Naga37s-1]